jgi:hypothetical protein
MRSGCKVAKIRKIQVLGDEESSGRLGFLPNLFIVSTGQSLVRAIIYLTNPAPAGKIPA